jgi:hypothetical protein
MCWFRDFGYRDGGHQRAGRHDDRLTQYAAIFSVVVRIRLSMALETGRVSPTH